MDSIGKRIRYARKKSQLSIPEVSEKTGLSTGNLSELENDKFAPSANSLIAFRKTFNVHIDWILTGKPPMVLSSDQGVYEEQSSYLSETERKLLQSYRALEKENQRDIQGYINIVTHSQKNIKK